MDSGLKVLKDLIGCRIYTHYNTGGIITEVSGPYIDERYTITYKHDRDGSKCWINTIQVKHGVITCEGIPLKISGKPTPRQLSLFDLF